MDSTNSQADNLRNHINAKLDAKFDFSLSSNRTKSMQEFLDEINKGKQEKDQIKIKTIRPSYNKLLQECLKNRGIEANSIGLKTKAPKFNIDLNAEIHPDPQSGKLDTDQSSVAGIATSKDGKPITKVDQPIQYNNFDAEGVGATFQALAATLKTAYPDLELLTEREKDSLGKMWLPVFNLYLTDRWAIIGVPTLATIGIFLPKVLKARKTKIAKQKELEIKDGETPDKEKVIKKVDESKDEKKYSPDIIQESSGRPPLIPVTPTENIGNK